MPRFRPLGLGDVFDEAFDLYKKNFLFLLLVAAVAAVPLHLIAPLLAHAFPNEPSLDTMLLSGFGDLLPAQELNAMGPFFNGPAIFACLYPIVSTVQIVALISACSASYLGEPRTLWSLYRPALRRLLPLCITLLLYALLMTGGTVLCYVGLVLPLTLLAFTGHAFAVEHLSYGKALRRSSRLVSGFGMRVFGCLVLLFLVDLLVGWGIRFPLTYAFDLGLRLAPISSAVNSGMGLIAAHTQQQQIVQDITGGLSELLLTPFVFSVLTVLYYDLRVRKEAFDITLLARELNYPSWDKLGPYLPPVTPLPAPITMKAVRRSNQRGKR